MEVWTVFLSRHALSRISLTLRLVLPSIRSLIEAACLRKWHQSVLYPSKEQRRLYLNIFRGEPAISWFDRHITPNHKSSHRFVTLTSSGLLPAFAGVHPAHG